MNVDLARVEFAFVIVIILLPVVLAYQTWTYYVFRRRVSREEFAAPRPARQEPATEGMGP